MQIPDIPNPSVQDLEALQREAGFRPVINPSPDVLQPGQLEAFNERGYLMPFTALDANEIAELRAFFDGILEAAMARGEGSYSINTAHLKFPEVYDLMGHPGILGPVRDLLGNDVVAWGAHFFCKMPRDGKRVPWHQDFTYWPLTPTRTVTVWLAIDDASPENANMRFIPRSHLHGLIDYRRSDAPEDVLQLAIDEPERFGDPPVDVALRAGQFSIHSDLLLHGSEANASDHRRCGLTMRYAAASVRAHFGWDAKGIVVSGEDREGNWQNPPRPAS